MDDATDSDRSGKQRLIVEVSVVMFVLWLPTIWGNVARMAAPALVVRSGGDLVYDVIYFVGRFAVLLFIMAGTKQGLGHFGFDKFRSRHIGITAAATGAALLAMLVVLGLIRQFFPQQLPSPAAAGLRPARIVWLLLFAAPVGAAWQELLFRGFLVTRAIDLGASGLQAVAIAAIAAGLWAMGAGATSTALTVSVGIVYGFFFLRFRSIWPVAGAHILLMVADYAVRVLYR